MTMHARLADWILACAIDRDARRTALGDLLEEHAIRTREQSSARAMCWYWAQVLRSLPWFLWEPIRRSGVATTLGVASAACALQAIVEILLAMVFRASMAPTIPAAPVMAFVVILTSLFTIGYVVARIRPGAGSMFALVVLALLIIQALVSPPLTFSLSRLAMQIAALFAALAGSAVSINRRHRVEAP